MNRKQLERLARLMRYCLERCERSGGATTPTGRKWYNAGVQIWLALPAGYDMNHQRERAGGATRRREDTIMRWSGGAFQRYQAVANTSIGQAGRKPVLDED